MEGLEYFLLSTIRRHLDGSYNADRCSVFEAIRGLCREGARIEHERQGRAGQTEQRAVRPPEAVADQSALHAQHRMHTSNLAALAGARSTSVELGSSLSAVRLPNQQW